MLTETAQDRSPTSSFTSFSCSVKRSKRRSYSQIPGYKAHEVMQVEEVNYGTQQLEEDLTQTNSLITITIDATTLKRDTIYDKAKLKVYLEQCRKLRKKAEFDSIEVLEQDLRKAIEELHDGDLVQEYY